MNNILTAKEWLEKETFRDGIMPCKNKENLMLSDLVEKYANYKNRILEERIMEFRQYLVLKIAPYTNNLTERWYLEQYDKHFNIQNNIKE